jgi:hypothetical protein
MAAVKSTIVIHTEEQPVSDWVDKPSLEELGIQCQDQRYSNGGAGSPTAISGICLICVKIHSADVKNQNGRGNREAT